MDQNGPFGPFRPFNRALAIPEKLNRAILDSESSILGRKEARKHKLFALVRFLLNPGQRAG